MRVEFGLQHFTSAADYKSSLLATNAGKALRSTHELTSAGLRAAIEQAAVHLHSAQMPEIVSSLRTLTIPDSTVIRLRETAPETPECAPAQPLPIPQGALRRATDEPCNSVPTVTRSSTTD